MVLAEGTGGSVVMSELAEITLGLVAKNKTYVHVNRVPSFQPHSCHVAG